VNVDGWYDIGYENDARAKLYSLVVYYEVEEGVLRKSVEKYYIAIGYDENNDLMSVHFKHFGKDGRGGYRFFSLRPSKETLAKFKVILASIIETKRKGSLSEDKLLTAVAKSAAMIAKAALEDFEGTSKSNKGSNGGHEDITHM